MRGRRFSRAWTRPAALDFFSVVLYNIDIDSIHRQSEVVRVRYNYGDIGPEHESVDVSFHEVYYASKMAVDVNDLYMQVNRAGIALQTPENFLVVRDGNYRYSLIHCVLHGKGNVSCRGHNFSVHSGQAFVLAPNEGHMYYSDPKDPMGVVWIEYGGGNATQLTTHIVDFGGPIYEGAIFTSLVNQLTSILYQPRQEGTGISMKLYQILMTLCEQVEIESSSRTVNHEILQYIDEHIYQRINLQALSATFGYHPTYLSSIFPNIAGTSFSKYVASRKISHACYLLETTNWSVEAIAQKLCFCNMSHFIRRFREIKGTTPLAFRNNSILYQKRHARRQLTEA